jgi:hypothetical protein
MGRTGFVRSTRPPMGTPLDSSSQLQRGLIFFAPFWEAAGKSIHDLVGGNHLTVITGSPAWGPGVAGSSICGFDCPNNAFIRSAGIPAGQQAALVWPMTVAVSCNVLTEQSATVLFSLTNFTGLATIIGITGGTTSGLGSAYLNAGSQVATNRNNNITLGQNVVASFTVTPTAQTMYINGLPTSGNTSNAASNPTLNVPAVYLGGGSTASVLYYWAAAWSRALSPGEHAALAQNIWQMFTPIYPAAVFGGQPSGVPHVSILRPVMDRSGSRRCMLAE